ncbi:hypothetical protein FACS189499_02860 [Clostridia bacterium]|nr:hypothetical protein FACS189499_02860 [Clostridia bacterium]
MRGWENLPGENMGTELELIRNITSLAAAVSYVSYCRFLEGRYHYRHKAFYKFFPFLVWVIATNVVKMFAR